MVLYKSAYCCVHFYVDWWHNEGHPAVSTATVRFFQCHSSANGWIDPFMETFVPTRTGNMFPLFYILQGGQLAI